VRDRPDLFQEWRTADRVAFDAERALLRASMQAIYNTTQLPCDAERDRVRRLWETANDLFMLSMAEMAAAANQAGVP